MIDVSGLSYFMPLFGFLFIFVVVYALLSTKEFLGDSKFVNLLVSFIVAIIFATVAPAQEFVQTITPWFVGLLVSLFFILVLVGMSQKEVGDIIGNKFVWFLVAVLILIFLVSMINIFPHVTGDFWKDFSDFITTEARVAGSLILLVVAAITAWVLSRS